MKKYIIASAAIVFAFAIQSCNTESKKETTTTMDGMAKNDSMNMDQNNMEGMHSMGSMKMTGDFDYDFANTMLMHHQSAVDMAKDVISKGSNAEVKTMAQNIVTAQEGEIAQLKNIIANYKMPEMKKENGEAHNELGETMEKMETKMKGMAKTGNADKDFLMMMIPHHESAVDMAKEVMAKGSNAEVKTMAQNIVTAQEAEIAQFKNIIANYKMPEMKEENKDAHNELGETMEKMETKMKGMAKTGNADKDFLMMMIPHHESAVTMGEDQLSHGKNLELKKMAQKIMEDQNKEIKQFEAMLAKMK